MQESEEEPKRVWRVLIVDDDAGMARALRRGLSFHLKDRVVIDLATDGAEGLGKVDASLDILITDYQMPKMNGPELIMLARHIAPRLKVILMSGDTGAAERLAVAVKDPTIRTMDKPFAAAVLLALMAEMMT